MRNKFFLSIILLTQFQYSITGDNQVNPWDRADLLDDFPTLYATEQQVVNNNSNNMNNSADNDDKSFTSMINMTNSSSSCSSSAKRTLEDLHEHNNENFKKSKISSTELVNKHPLNLTWNDKEKGFDFHFTEKKTCYLPHDLSLKIIEYLTPSLQEEQQTFRNLQLSLKTVNGIKFLNYVSMLHAYNKIQSIQDPYLPARPHPLLNSVLLKSISQPQIPVHQSEKDKIENFKSFPIMVESSKIYQTQDQRISHYKTHYWMMKKLLEYRLNSNVYISEDDWSTILFFTAQCRNKEKESPAISSITAEEHNFNLMNLLLENKVNHNIQCKMNTKDESILRALHTAVESCNVLGVKALLTYIVDKQAFKITIDKKDSRGDSALSIAVKAYNPEYEIIKLLLDNKANVNIQNKIKNTPLHIIAKKSDVHYRLDDSFYKNTFKITQLLLENGADKKILNQHDETIMSMILNQKKNTEDDTLKNKHKNQYIKSFNQITDDEKLQLQNDTKIKFFNDIIDLLNSHP